MKSFLLSKISDMCDTADNTADKTAIHVTQLMHGPAKLYHPHHYTVDSVLILIHMHTYSSENEFSLTYFAPQLECCTSALYEVIGDFEHCSDSSRDSIRQAGCNCKDGSLDLNVAI